MKLFVARLGCLEVESAESTDCAIPEGISVSKWTVEEVEDIERGPYRHAS